MTQMSRAWAMPNPDTFSIGPIAMFIERWLDRSGEVVDPFARNSRLGTVTNDLNPETHATYHMEAGDFCDLLIIDGVQASSVIFDPPYSPRQISEVYAAAGLDCGMKETQNSALYKRVRDRLDPLLVAGGIALSFGWNSAGFGKERGYELLEVLLVAHGGAHNDTICVAERKLRGGLL